jgi:hypothetical protein
VNRPLTTMLRLPALVLALTLASAAPGAARAADPVLTVATSGGGSVAGPGIACPRDCAEPYVIRTIRVCEHTPENLPGQCEWVEEPQPQTITLTAQTPPGRQFTGWGGQCAGTGACTVTMDDDHAVTAAWAPSAVTPAATPAPAPAGGTGDGAATPPAAGGVTVTGVAPAAGHGSASVRPVRAPGSVRFILDYSYQRDTRAAWFTQLSLHGLARRTHVRVDCQGAGCPSHAGNLRLLLRRRLRPGARIAIQMTHARLAGRVVRLTIGRNRRPAVDARCLAPGSGKPRACGR